MICNPNYKTIKKAVRKSLFPDPYFVSKYQFSPYMACGHACKYCDGRAEKYHVEDDYETDIIVRENILSILEKELPKLRERGTILIGSGISDVYQPLEKDEKIMQKIALLLSEFSFSVTVITKSSLIERDLKIWQKINQQSKFTLMMSITSANEKIASIFEPGASRFSQRIETLHKFKQAGIQTGVLAMPFLPYLTDNQENIQNLIKKLKSISVDFVLPGFLTLRPGRQKELFFSIIKQKYPQILPKYENLYRHNYPSGIPEYDYRTKKFNEVQNLLQENNILMNAPFSSFRDQFEWYDEIFIFLHHLKTLYKQKGVNTKRLKAATRNYTNWLQPLKKDFNRKRSIKSMTLNLQIKYLLQTGEFRKIIQNEKLSHFLQEIFIQGKTFDYHKLNLKG